MLSEVHKKVAQRYGASVICVPIVLHFVSQIMGHISASAISRLGQKYSISVEVGC